MLRRRPFDASLARATGIAVLAGSLLAVPGAINLSNRLPHEGQPTWLGRAIVVALCVSVYGVFAQFLVNWLVAKRAAQIRAQGSDPDALRFATNLSLSAFPLWCGVALLILGVTVRTVTPWFLVGAAGMAYWCWRGRDFFIRVAPPVARHEGQQ